MLGCYDFCGHYDWTFAWLAKNGGDDLLQTYWREAISEDSQRHAAALIRAEGFEGMKKYWGHILAEESPDQGYRMDFSNDQAWLQFHDCPSRGFLIRNQVEFSTDYCDHCIAWIRPILTEAGFKVEHEHNHRGQCWWNIRHQSDDRPLPAPGEAMPPHDVRTNPAWNQPAARHHHFPRPTTQTPPSPPPA